MLLYLCSDCNDSPVFLLSAEKELVVEIGMDWDLIPVPEPKYGTSTPSSSALLSSRFSEFFDFLMPFFVLPLGAGLSLGAGG